MPNKALVRSRAAELRARFEKAGAAVAETSLLQPADVLLDLYGEDIRARAYVTSDSLLGEQMLRPDFTVPVVRMHMEHGAEPARYTYAGEVFRRQEADARRANEYTQVGYEVFDGQDPAAADAEVFALIQDTLSGLRLRAATGDIGLLLAAVRGLDTTEARKAALTRHIWRPRRFRALIERFAGRTTEPPHRAALLADGDPLQSGVPFIGLRTPDEVRARIARLREDAAEPPLSTVQVDLIDAILNVRETLPFALERLRDIAVDMPAITEAVFCLRDRIEALDKRGVDVNAIQFEGSYGRTNMEYYDGFVFGFYADHADLPPVATGGRYDALTRVLGQDSGIPAVGAVIRPDVMLKLEGQL
ncbi:ATP phosphoribosyltransferase regulatory subunit [Cognatishimia sp. SS12]|uniref:ATP phosphoribosyltransferase regulatory subunit n=1 Tax=Cognatishimia sp. SS12 TaxID=2979465 RepID=UPI00232B86A1|nr:ATP phosphoribosyltransferase regulatory subunit [Cognatishimia sp. SS12]MDC0738106.1 ATP phosphoribosyltransferase regulatory subunit [Cognatishimia sp. SS12]